ncbi:Small-conductance mechanosensitive channel [gamma proteobacterium IMCC2047]|nr:Small-conductance mechanosensitive channel [gamma proteobacterium IMCC2047]
MNVLITVSILLALFISIRFTTSTIERFGVAKSVSPYRVKYIAKTVNLALVIFYLILLVTFLGIEYSQISIFLSSVFAVIGVALFAQWSILSNITASLIIFFGFPYRVGDYIRVIDEDDGISGVIVEISLFHVLIKKGDELITYPNTLILQKAVVKLPAEPLASSDEPPNDK